MRGACFAPSSLPTCAIPLGADSSPRPAPPLSASNCSTASSPTSNPYPPPPLSPRPLPPLLLLDSALLLLPAASSPLLAARLRRLLPPPSSAAAAPSPPSSSASSAPSAPRRRPPPVRPNAPPRQVQPFVWNTLISAYADSGLFEDALALFFQMDEEDDDAVAPDRFTFPRALKACAGVGSLPLGLAVHRRAVRAGFGADVFVLNALVDMYAKCGDIQRARRAFDAIARRDLVSWNSMLIGYLRHGLLLNALDICRRMLDAGFEPDSITISAILSGFSSSSSSAYRNKLGIEIHGWAIRTGSSTIYRNGGEVRHKAGDGALRVRGRHVGEGGVGRRGLQSYIQTNAVRRRADRLGALLFACSVRGNVEIGETAAERLFELEPDNEHNFELLMQIYRDAGRLEDAERVRRLMKARGLLERCDESSLSGSCIHIE
uniref:Pentatricopeptide repeat-containing protein n=1 Tax=Ananas comosus var. bracteatus TaxID=296719 RepID=A0A6V7NK55_ANACO|nr:unnamed protein product [Ananas comosus var. bracteatus]